MCTWHTSIVGSVVILWMAAATILGLREFCRRLHYERLWNTWVGNMQLSVSDGSES